MPNPRRPRAAGQGRRRRQRESSLPVWLGPDQGRRTIDELQSSPVKKPTVDLEDTTVPDVAIGQVSVRILRPRAPTDRWR